MTIKDFLKKITPFRFKLRLMMQEIKVKLFPAMMSKRLYESKMHKPLNLDDPKDLNEKIHWLKIYSDTSMWPVLADKYRVREYVKEKGLGHLLNKLYGVWKKPEDIDFDSLPSKFVLKLNNGWADAVIVKDKSKIDQEAARKKMKERLKHHFGAYSVEPHYLKIPPRIIAEELLEDKSVESFSRSLVDYKVWCFDGEPFGIFIVYDREIGTAHHYFDFYDLDWNQHMEYLTDQTPRHLFPKPKNLDKMIEAASILSKGYPQMRVDFYDIDGVIRFGEITLTSATGCMDYFTPELLLVMGEKCKIKK